MTLYDLLENKKSNHGNIDFYEHISKVKSKASKWLKGIEKNGIEHSQRIENNLDKLIPDEFKKKLSPAEIFILLYAVYLHDIGYRLKSGEIESRGHPLRSKEYILNDPDKYLFGQFKRMNSDELPLAAQSVAEVCYGHAHESIYPLKSIPNDFPDACLSSERLNLRRLAALLWLADEADQVYIRLGDTRKYTTLPEIMPGIIRLCWKGDRSIGEKVSKESQKINETLEPVNNCLRDWNFPKTTVVLDPLFKKPFALLTKPIDYKEFIPEHYIEQKCHGEDGKDKGSLLKFAHDWLNDPERKLLAVLGDFGIGKTSFCYKFTSEIKCSKYLPVVVELSTVRDKGWKNSIQEKIKEAGNIGKKDIVLILDAFDEISIKFDKNKVLEEIENLSETARPYQKVILTSRTPLFRSLDEEREMLSIREKKGKGPKRLAYKNFERIYISLFDEGQIKEYLNLTLGEDIAEDFWRNTIKRVYDMAGNVLEWTDSWYDYDKKKKFKVLRGGSWDGDADNARCAFRFGYYLNFWLSDIGFRCAKDLKK